MEYTLIGSSLPGHQIIFYRMPYFLDYKMYFSPKIWEENRDASYSLNVAYFYIGEILLFMLLNILPHFLLQIFFSYFPPLKPWCILWTEKQGT